jgi:hypothetical protein
MLGMKSTPETTSKTAAQKSSQVPLLTSSWLLRRGRHSEDEALSSVIQALETAFFNNMLLTLAYFFGWRGLKAKMAIR